MLNLRILCISLIAVGVLLNIDLSRGALLDDIDFGQENYAECAIHNAEYPSWYLYNERYTYQGDKRNVTLNLFQMFADAKQGVWQFVPAEGIKNGFYLRNSKYSEDLFATTQFFTGLNPFSQKRRMLFTWRLNKQMQLNEKAFIWLLSKADTGKPNDYYIYNLAFQEPLYAASWTYKTGVFTWHKKHEPKNKQFIWTLKCLKNAPL